MDNIINIPVKTKKVKGKWFCYCTVDGYDYSFEGQSQDEATLQMLDIIKKKPKYVFKFEPIELIKRTIPIKTKFHRPKIDNNPIA